MTGEWEEKKGQKQTDRWSGKVMQLKRVEFHTPRLKHIYVFKKKNMINARQTKSVWQSMQSKMQEKK